MSLTLNTLQVLPVANDTTTYYVSMQPATGGKTPYEYVTPALRFYPANNSLLMGSANAQFSSLGVGTAGSGVAGEIRATNNITAYYSDDRLKTKLGNIQNALEKIKSLNGFHYQANQVAQSLGYAIVPEVGVSAQEVQKVLPEAVVAAPIDDKYFTVHYQKIIPLLIEAVKELSEKVERLEKNNE
jgi:hypothetical protein